MNYTDKRNLEVVIDSVQLNLSREIHFSVDVSNVYRTSSLIV